METVILIMLAAVLVGAGIGLLPPSSPRRRKASAIAIAGPATLILSGAVFLIAELTARGRGGAFSFLALPVELLSRWGEAVLNCFIRPHPGLRTVLAALFLAGSGLFVALRRREALPIVLSWAAILAGVLSVSFWGERELAGYWIFCGIGIVCGFLPAIRSTRRRDEGLPIGRRMTAIVLCLIVISGFILRFYKLDLMPAAVLDYEGTTGLSGIEVLEGNRGYHRLLWSFTARPIMNTYSVPFFAFPLALLFRCFGVSLITLRSLAALLGTVSIGAMYALVRARYSRLRALLCAFFLAVSVWHVTLSRVGLPLVLTPLYALLIGWFLLRAFRTRRWRYYVLAGIALGCYWLFYMVGKIMLPVTAVLVLQQAVVKKRFLREHWIGLGILCLTVLLIACLSGLGPEKWLLGIGKQDKNFIWYRTGTQSVYTPETDWGWTGFYLRENIKRSFHHLFFASHHEFLLPSKLPLISPLLFPFCVMGFFCAVFGWKRDLNFFFIALALAAFIPQVVFATFQDKASPRHLMLLIPSFCYFTALPFALLGDGLLRLRGRSGAIIAATALGPFLAAVLLIGFFITFLSPHWEYRVCRMRRDCAEFILRNLDQHYFYIVRSPDPLYLQNRIIDFITYPRVEALHYHVPDDYPREGKQGPGERKMYHYVPTDALPRLFDGPEHAAAGAGFIFEQKELVPLFEARFGKGSVRERCRECAPWVYYSFFYPDTAEKEGTDASAKMDGDENNKE